MASLLETQRAFRRRLLRADADTARQLVRVYAQVRRAIRIELDVLISRIAEARLAGETVNQSWLFAEARYRNLLQQADVAYRLASSQASGVVTRTQMSATQLGAEAAEALVRSLAPPQIPLSWSQLPVGAIESFIGFASDGSPLSALFDALGPEGSAAIRSALIRGIGLGLGPREIARNVSNQIGMSLTRALTISRTEVIRAYRTAQGEAYRANSGVVEDKMWHCALDDRSCSVCIAGHGTLIGLTGDVYSHPSCRCTAIPVTRPWSELGYSGIEDTNPEHESGADWFDRQPIERQVAALGSGRYAAFSEGRLRLADMIGRRVDRRWGPTRYVLPLREALKRTRRVA